MDTKKYNDYVEQVTPKHSCFLNTVKAFISGGILCLIGQALTNLFISTGMSLTLASSYTTLCLIAASILLTGFNLVVPIVKFAGAGYLVPITGFANSVAACAIEFKQDACVIITLNQESRCFRGEYVDLVQFRSEKRRGAFSRFIQNLILVTENRNEIYLQCSSGFHIVRKPPADQLDIYNL